MRKKNSPFTIAARDIEVSFTFYLGLGGTLQRDPALSVAGERNVKKSELGIYFSSDFLEKLVVAHFHVKTGNSLFRVNPHGEDVAYAEDRPYRLAPLEPIKRQKHDSEFDSISALECTVFKNGYIAVSLRFQNVEPIPAKAFISMIRHPEFLRMQLTPDDESGEASISSDATSGTQSTAAPHPTLTPGPLVEIAADRLRNHWPNVRERLKRLGLERRTIDEGVWTACENDVFGDFRAADWSRPYVGTVFRVAGKQPDPEDLRCFVIAAGRPTPSFVDGFIDSEGYLKAGVRNVYGPGRSMVFVGRRGWCVYDALDHNPDAFRLGVIETTEFVVSAFDTSARALRKYAVDVHEKGMRDFKQLNIAVNYLVTGLNGRRRCTRDALTNSHTGLVFERSLRGRMRRAMACISPWFPLSKAVADATSFVAKARLVSPCEDMIGLLETHLTSHSARAAVNRQKQLTDFEALVRASRELMSNYTAFLKTSADYLSLRTLQLTRAAVIVGVIGLFWDAWQGSGLGSKVAGLLTGSIRP